jgi:hypothetical protein
VRLPFPVPVAIAALLAVFSFSPPAHADPSAWVFAGGGGMLWKQGENPLSPSGALSFDLGLGTTPDAPFIVGGLFRITPILGSGTDMAWLARVATRGFQSGVFGLALDAGAYARVWGTGSGGFTGSLTAGVPLGFSVSFQAMVGTGDTLGFGAIAGIDFLRLTLYRQTLLQWWPNPSAPVHSARGRSPFRSGHPAL